MPKTRLQLDAEKNNYRIKTFQFKKFRIDAPESYRKPGFMDRLLAGADQECLLGPKEAKIAFKYGPAQGGSDPQRHLDDVTHMAGQHGHDVLRGALLQVDGAQHAVITVDVPLSGEAYVVAPSHGVRMRNYFLRYPGWECVVTCKVATIQQGRMIVHGYEESYDEIVETFCRVR